MRIAVMVLGASWATLEAAGSSTHILQEHLAAHSPLFLLVLISYVTGLVASLTPCIYPMIPVTIGIITAQKSASMPRNFAISVMYGLGIATVYSILGYISAKSSFLFGQWVGNPYFILVVSLFYLSLAFSLFGFYEIRFPRFLEGRFVGTGGSVLYSYLSGMVSGAAASPCLTPALALILGFVAKQATPLAGIAILFSFALGLSTLLIVVGTFSSSLALLPRAGGWMEHVKMLFGFLLLLVIVHFCTPLMPLWAVPLAQGMVMLSAAGYYAYRSTQTRYHAVALRLLAAFLLLLAALCGVESVLQHSGFSLFDYVG